MTQEPHSKADLSRVQPRLIIRGLARTPLYPALKKCWGQLERLRWFLKGRTVPPPRSVKQQIVRQYGRRFGLQVLVETGTFLGDMVRAMNPHFDKIYTIEIDPGLHERARQVLIDLPHVHPILGDSSESLPEILEGLGQPALFWLDAHYSDEATARGEKETVLLSELTHILGGSNASHVVLIDDMRAFNGSGGYPAREEIEHLVNRWRPGWVVEVVHDVMRIHPPSGV